MSEKETVRIAPNNRELKGVFDALKTLEKEANVELKNDVAGISLWTAQQIIAAAPTAIYPKQAMKVAKTVRASRDRVPKVVIGGSRERFSGGAVSGQVLFGNEFGGPSLFPNGGKRFPWRSPAKGRGNEGYWIFPTLTKAQPEITRRWITAVDKVLSKWEGTI